MEKYDVLISPAAQSDFQSVQEYLGTLPAEESNLYFEKFMEEVKTLRSAPKSCPFTRDPQLRLRGYRILSAMDYLLFFIMNGSGVEIRRILYAKRQYDRLV